MSSISSVYDITTNNKPVFSAEFSHTRILTQAGDVESFEISRDLVQNLENSTTDTDKVHVVRLL